ncbi:MAG: hypothetical protein QW153_01800 [Candidatus Bilamarchaeaceae archaeon]
MPLDKKESYIKQLMTYFENKKYAEENKLSEEMIKKFGDFSSYLFNAQAKYFSEDFEGATESGKRAFSLAQSKREKFFVQF